MQVEIKKSNLYGSIKAPPSKSMAHRLLICAAFSGGKCTIDNVDFSEDILSTINCLNALSIKTEINNNSVTVYGKSYNDIKVLDSLNCNECGSTLRFFIPIVWLINKEVTFIGTQKLLSRPLSVYEDLANINGFIFNKQSTSLITKGLINSGTYNLDGSISSQFISGLIFALTFLNKKSVINLNKKVESRSYINLTISALNLFGADVYFNTEKQIIINKSLLTPKNIEVEADYSNAAFLEALNYLGNNISVLGLNKDSLQGDKVYNDYYLKLKNSYCTLDISDCPDLGPILITLACFLNGAEFTGTKRLKIKESDRANAIKEELLKFGANITVLEDSVIVKKTNLFKPKTVLYGHNDHRIVMSLANPKLWDGTWWN